MNEPAECIYPARPAVDLNSESSRCSLTLLTLKNRQPVAEIGFVEMFVSFHSF